MSEPHSFADLIRRVRGRDAEAAAELVRRYEPAIRRAVRIRLIDARMRRVLDSMDICQSVLGSFFAHAAEDRYELDTPDQLIKLLIGMVRNKLVDQLRHERAERRDNRRVQAGLEDASAVVAAGPSPSQQIARQDFSEQVRLLLTAEDRFLLERRERGHSWSEIAGELGGSPEALRKRLTRALAEAVRQLEPDESDHE